MDNNNKSKDSNKKKVTIKIDGKEYQVQEGLNIIDAAKEHDIEIPHYCYHPALSVAGNCRMCLCKIEGTPKPQISCSTIVKEGMEIFIKHPETEQYQNEVMDFLLINHPLDCPECDQAGECKLQDFAFKYGSNHGKFIDHELKVVKTTTKFGPHVRYWGSRCILCTRCVRFLREITETGELDIINRGDHAEIAIHPNHELDNPLAMNVIDICPVGALVSNDFLYKRRVWELKSIESISAYDSMGVNIYVDVYKNKIERIRPRINLDVNQYWIPDENRLDFDFVYSENRIKGVRINGNPSNYNETINKIAEILSENDKIAFYVSCHQSNESMFLIKKLLNESVSKSKNEDNIYLFHKEIEDDLKFPKFTINGDKNPNRKGAEIIFGKNADETKKLTEEIKNNNIKTLVVIGGIPNYDYNEELIKELSKLNRLIVMDLFESEITKNADVVISLATYFEQSGTFTNFQNRVQRFNLIHEPVVPSISEVEVLQSIILKLSNKNIDNTKNVSDIFDEMKDEILEFNNMDYDIIDNLGMKTKLED